MLVVLVIIFILEIMVPAMVIFMFMSGVVSVLHGAPYVPMWRNKIDRMLKSSGLGSGDVLYDLGCGDGRILLSAAGHYPIKKAIGYEVSLWPYLRSRWNVRRSGLLNVEIRHQNFFEADLSEATFVYAYLFPKLMQRLAKKLAAELKPGSRVLCPSFPIDLAACADFELIKEEKIDTLTIYVYVKIGLLAGTNNLSIINK